MKKLIFMFIIMLLFPFVTFAHPGRTDSNGGHWDRSNGTYHFHTGEYAGKDHSSSSSDTEYEPFTPPYDPPTDNPYRKNTKNSTTESSNEETPEWLSSVIFYGLSLWPLVFIFAILLSKTKDNLERLLYDYDTCISRFFDCKKTYELKREELKNSTKPSIPDNYEIDIDGLPKEKASRGWGKPFTVYVTPSGKKLHQKRGCSRAFQPRNLGTYILKGLDLYNLKCSKCFIEIPHFAIDWYYNYTNYEKMIKQIEQHKNVYEDSLKKLQKIHFICNNTYKYKLLRLFSKKHRRLKQLNQKYKKIKNDENKMRNFL